MMVKEENMRSEHKLLENPAPSVQGGGLSRSFFRCQAKYVHVCLDFIFPIAEHYGCTYRRWNFAPEEAFVGISGGATKEKTVKPYEAAGSIEGETVPQLIRRQTNLHGCE